MTKRQVLFILVNRFAIFILQMNNVSFRQSIIYVHQFIKNRVTEILEVKSVD